MWWNGWNNCWMIVDMDEKRMFHGKYKKRGKRGIVVIVMVVVVVVVVVVERTRGNRKVRGN